MNKVSCEFAVITNDLDCHIVTKELNIEPDRFFNKGDRVVSKHSTKTGYKPYGLWAIQSKFVICEEIEVSNHINYFKELLKDKIDIIENFKNQYHFECIFAISIETEDSGAGYDLDSQELCFLEKIVSRFSCNIISKETI